MSLKHALLGMLADRPGSGYELTKRFELSLGNVWSAKHSQIYPELQKMTGLGWVTAGEEGARGRREYTITDDGRAELREWLTAPHRDRNVRNESMLRAFFLWTLPPDDAVRYLEGEADGYRAARASLDALDAGIPWDSSGSDLMGRIVLEQGRQWVDTMAEWADWAAGQVRAGHDATTLDLRRRP